jgi:hypothetical protein
MIGDGDWGEIGGMKVIRVISASYQYLCKGEENLYDVYGDYK